MRKLLIALCLVLSLAACSTPSQPSLPSVAQAPTLDPNAPTGRPPLAPAQPASQVELKLDVMDTCWARITSDGKVVFEGQLEPGGRFQYTGQQVRVRASNGAALLLTPNGLPSEFLGRMGKPSEKVFRLQDGKIYVDTIDPPS